MESRLSKVDPVSGIPLVHLTFILNGFLPTSRFNIESIDEREKIFEERAPCPPESFLHAFLCGSGVEGLAIPGYHLLDTEPLEVIKPDMDCLYIDKDCIVVQADTDRSSESSQQSANITLSIDDSGCNNGYARLRKSQDWIGLTEAGKWYKFSDIVDGKRLFLTRPGPFFGQVEKHGPSMKMVHLKIDEHPVPLLHDPQHTVDQVYALRCGKWPKQAGEWMTRHRTSGWPSLDSIARLSSNGCHLVQVAHPNSLNREEEEWRFSFSAAELVLARSLSAVQRKCYVLFKIAVTCALGPTEILSSYHLKTVLLWTCEEIPAAEFTENTVGERYLDLIDKLIVFLTDRHLPNYFVCRNNMINHRSLCDIEAALLIIQKLRNSPLDVLVQFDKRKRFTFAMKRYSIEETMKVVFVHMNRVRNGGSSRGLAVVFDYAFQLNLLYNMEEHLYVNVLDTLVQMMSFKNFMRGTDIVPQVLDDWLKSPPMLHIDDFTILIFWQFCLHERPIISINKDISTYAFKDELYSNLARYFLRQRCHMEVEISAQERSMLDLRIHYAFLIALNTVDVSPRNILDSHSWLFFDQNKFGEDYIPGDDSLQKLQILLRGRKTISGTYSSDVEECASYEMEDQYLIHDPLLRLEIEGAGYIRVPVTVYLHYLLTVRAVKLYGHHSIEALLKLHEMFSESVRYEDDSRNIQIFQFLGYACMYVGAFNEAFICFQSASVLGNKCPNACMMKSICLGILTYEEYKHMSHALLNNLDLTVVTVHENFGR